MIIFQVVSTKFNIGADGSLAKLCDGQLWPFSEKKVVVIQENICAEWALESTDMTVNNLKSSFKHLLHINYYLFS